MRKKQEKYFVLKKISIFAQTIAASFTIQFALILNTHYMDTKKKIVVIGSSNTDMVIKSDRLPKPGETILGGNFLMNHGGKGANQAVAAARLGGDVTFICKIGNDFQEMKPWKCFTKKESTLLM